MKRILALFTILLLASSCDFISDIIDNPDISDESPTVDAPVAKYAYSTDFAEGSHSFIFEDGRFIIFTPDSLSGYYICADSLDMESYEFTGEPLYAQCDSLMRPVFAKYKNATYRFSNYTEHTFDVSIYVDGQESIHNGCSCEYAGYTTKGSTETAKTNLDKAGYTVDVLNVAIGTLEKGKRGFFEEMSKALGLNAVSEKTTAWTGFAAGVIEAFMNPASKLGAAGLVIASLQVMKEEAEFSSSLLISDITPKLEGVYRFNHNSVKVVFGISGYSSGTKDVPIGTIHYSKDKGGWKQGEVHHINGTQQYYEETFSDLKSGRYGFRCIVYPSVYIGDPLLQQYYGFKTDTKYIDISPVYMSELALQSTVRQDDLILTSVRIKLDYLSEEDQLVFQYSDDYGVCITQDGKQEFYSAKSPENANDEFHITLNLPFEKFQDIGDDTYVYFGDLEFCVYYTSYGVKELRDQQTLEILYTEDDRWVDLGLSVLWAKYNVGATSPEEYGGYYAWGETEEKSSYTWENYKYGTKDSDGYWTGEYIGSEISGTEYDVAHVKWGGGARMPKLSEIQELVEKCSWSSNTYNGVREAKVTGPNGNSIFLPFAGYRDKDGLYDEGSFGCYWSGTDYDEYGSSAYVLAFYGGDDYWDYFWDGYGRCYGRSVRPVTEK